MRHINSMSRAAIVFVISFSCSVCASAVVYRWGQINPAEYVAVAQTGGGSVVGQAFLKQRNGQVRYGAGNEVTLDPATSYSTKWWNECARLFKCKSNAPGPDSVFLRARRTTTSDGEGRFRFEALPAGEYYVRTYVLWEATTGYLLRVPINEMQGGIVAEKVVVEPDKRTDVVLTWH